MREFSLTICTPTYNRAYILPKLFESLKRQTCKDFEWVIVDDGSTDNTENLIAEWQANACLIDIKYFKTENGGKHRAVNYGLDVAKGLFFLVMDSDDYLTDDAVEKIKYWCLSLPENSNIVGIVANRGYSSDVSPNSFFKGAYRDHTFFDMKTYTENGKYVLDGEKAIVFYTDFHRRYKYPEFEGEKFVTEAVAYNRMAADGYKMRFYNDIVWIYEYLPDGLTNQGCKLFISNPHGYGIFLKEKLKFEKTGLIKKIKCYYTFACDLSSEYGAKTIAECIGTSYLTIEFLLMLHKLRNLMR